MPTADLSSNPNAVESEAISAATHQPLDMTAATIWLRRWGVLFACDASGREAALIDPAEAVCYSNDDRKTGVLIDGPLSADACRKLGLSFEDHHAQELFLDLDLHGRFDQPDQQGLERVHVARQIDQLRRIPSDRGEQSAPYVYGPGPDNDECAIAFKSLNAPAGWRVLATAAFADEAGHLPVIVSDGRRIASGLPLIELMTAKMTMPACRDGYWKPLRKPVHWILESWLVDQMIVHARLSGLTVLFQHHWPSGFDAALTIRHDYDRPIADDMLSDLLDAYDRHDVKCSVGFLGRLQPAEQMAALHERGHEIVLHSEAAFEAEFAAEAAALQTMGSEMGFDLAGVTCHGGIGSAGHLGSTTFAWAASAGLGYTEQLGPDALIPHPALHAGVPGACGPESLMITPMHQSLDIGTAPRAHALTSLADNVPRLLAAGGLVTVMNHPDIHLDQLKTLISWLDLSRVWRATHAEITAWCRQTKYAVRYLSFCDHVEVRFDRPLSHGLTIDILRPESASKLTLPPGTEVGRIDLGTTDLAMMIDRTDFVSRLGRGLERAAARFRKSAVCPSSPSDLVKPIARSNSPSRERIEQPARAAVIGRTVKEAEDAVTALLAIKGVFRFPPKDIRLFTLSGGEIGLPGTSETAASFFHTRADGLFDIVHVDPRVRLFDAPFGQAFIARANALAAAGGVVLLPDWRNQVAKGGVGPERLDAWMGVEGQPLGDVHRRYPARPSMPTPPSVLSWYGEQGAQLALEELLFRENDGDPSAFASDPLVLDFLLGGLSTVEGVRGARSGEGGGGVGEVLEDIVASHAYLISGVSYKAALIRHILETLMPGRDGLAYVDVGGGFGALAAELLLSSERERFAFAITRDIAGQNIPLARSLYAGLIDSLAGRFKFSLGPAESFVFDDGFDVISFVGSLLYVDKNELEALVDRVWSSIRPGGLLIVHENIKNPAFTRDVDVMFEADELDRLLGAYGPLRYFHSSACAALTADQVANKTVFRVLAKPA